MYSNYLLQNTGERRKNNEKHKNLVCLHLLNKFIEHMRSLRLHKPSFSIAVMFYLMLTPPKMTMGCYYHT